MVEDVEEDETEESEDDFYTSDIDPDWSKTPLMRRKRPNVSIFILPKKTKNQPRSEEVFKHYQIFL